MFLDGLWTTSILESRNVQDSVAAATAVRRRDLHSVRGQVVGRNARLVRLLGDFLYRVDSGKRMGWLWRLARRRRIVTACYVRGGSDGRLWGSIDCIMGGDIMR